MANKHVLAINPGSTSTKIAIFLDEEKILGQNISHTAEELAPFPRIIDQHHFRQEVILGFLKENNFDVKQLAAVVGRGGLLGPMASGTYLVNDEMTDLPENHQDRARLQPGGAAGQRHRQARRRRRLHRRPGDRGRDDPAGAASPACRRFRASASSMP